MEDAGLFCVDNMPVDLLPKFLELPIENKSGISGLAFVMDLREKGFIAKYDSVLSALRKKGYNFEILFLEADEKILVQRYSTTRRQHPLSHGKGLVDGIRTEKDLFKSLRAEADSIIDTSNLNVHELKAKMMDIVRQRRERVPMQIRVQSFGFKYGIPHDADLIMDVRFLANPYFVPELKELDGKTKEIQDFVLDHAETRTFLDKYLNLIDYLIPLYEKEGKAYLTIAIGCTGGRHRSVTIATIVYDHINTLGNQVDITHRDIGQSA